MTENILATMNAEPNSVDSLASVSMSNERIPISRYLFPTLSCVPETW